MRNLFHDPENQEAFDREGFVVFESFLSPSVVESLHETYRRFSEEVEEKSFHATCYSEDPEHRRAIRSALCEAIREPMETVLDDVVPGTGDFVVKEPLGGQMPLHQDWSIVDEREFRSVTLWCPLSDVDEGNGMLWVLRRSHENIVAWRGEAAPGLPHFFPVFEESISPEIREKYGVALPMKAGDAVFYDARTVHYSHPNHSAEVRVAFNVSLIPAETKPVHSYRTSNDTIELLEIEESFFTEHKMGASPDGIKIDEVPFLFEILYPEHEAS